MIRTRKFRINTLGTLASCVLSLTLSASFSIAHAEAFRPEIAGPLQAAQGMAKNHKYSEAMAKVREAEAVGGKTASENAAIEQMRGYIASISGDANAAARSYETQLESGNLSSAERLRAMQALASLYFQAHEYSKASLWTQRYLKEGGTDPQMRNLPLQLAFMNNDCPSVMRQLQPELRAQDALGRPASEDQLKMYANCADKTKDNAAYSMAMEKLVVYYPSKDYWAALLTRLERKPGFSSRLALDVYRLKLITGNLNSTSDYMEMTQLALQDGQNAEAKKVLDQGFSAGALGSGADLDRQNRLKALVAKRIADDQTNGAQKEAAARAEADGTNLLNIGLNAVSAGQGEKGLALMEQAIAKGLRHPDEGKLHLGMAYLISGQKGKAMPILKSVGDVDGTADVARLYMMARPVPAAVAEAGGDDPRPHGPVKPRKK